MTRVNLKNLDLNLLVVFEAIYSAGNISHAADQLAMSQPAVSNALGRLRELVGDQPFMRARHGVEPTGKAKEMIGPVRDAMALIKSQLGGHDTIDLATYTRQFRILVFDPLEPILMPPVIQRIIHEAPGVSIECPPPFRMDFTKELLAGTLDLACYVYPASAPDIVTVPVCPVDLVVIARRGHPQIGKSLNVETFMKLKHMMLIPELRNVAHVDKDMAANRVERKGAYMVGKMWSMPPMVERTDLVAIIPRWFAVEVSHNFDIEFYKVPIPLAEQHMYMMWHRKNEHDPGHRWLREILLAAIPQTQAKSSEVPSFKPVSARTKRD